MISGLLEIGIVIGLFGVFYYIMSLKTELQEDVNLDFFYYILLGLILLSSIIVGALFHRQVLYLLMKIPMMSTLIGYFYKGSQKGGASMEVSTDDNMEDNFEDIEIQDPEDDQSVVMDDEFEEQEFY